MTTETYCPKHFTLEDVDCHDGLVDCPPRLPLDPCKQVVVACGPCNRARVVPVDRIMKGKVPSSQCQLSECAATIILPVPTLPENYIYVAPGTSLLSPEAYEELRDRAPEGYVKVPEGVSLVQDAEFQALSEKAARYDDLCDELRDEPQGETPPGAGINQAAKPKSPSKASNRK